MGLSGTVLLLCVANAAAAIHDDVSARINSDIPVPEGPRQCDKDGRKGVSLVLTQPTASAH